MTDWFWYPFLYLSHRPLIITFTSLTMVQLLLLKFWWWMIPLSGVRELVSTASTWPTSPANNYFLKLPKISETCQYPKIWKKLLPLHLGSCDKNYIIFTFLDFLSKKPIPNVKNLENSIKAGGEMRTHDQYIKVVMPLISLTKCTAWY
jgi:hypothetical protein